MKEIHTVHTYSVHGLLIKQMLITVDFRALKHQQFW